MSDDQNLGIKSTLVGMQKAAGDAATSDQLDDRNIGLTVGQGLRPPYPPDRLASLQELNGTHAVCIAKKAQREVGYGFEIVSHDRIDPDDASEDERERVEDFWRGRESRWSLGPKGTPAATPTELFEKARQDYYGIGWLAIEIRYAGYDDEPAGMSYLPAKTVRVKKDKKAGKNEQIAGHGFVQKRDGKTAFFAEAGDRHGEDIDGRPDPTYVDKHSGDVYNSREAMENADGAEPANEILYIPNPHPNTLYYGLPTWISEIQTMVADQEARRFNRERLSNDMILDYIVKVEGGQLSEDSRREVREHIQGMRDSDGPSAWILEAEDLADSGIDIDSDVTISVEPMADFSDEDMSWTEYRDMNERDIAQVHEVPRQHLGHQDATNSNTEQAVREFTQEVIKPAQERFAERLYRIVHQQILDVHDWTLSFVTKGGDDRVTETEIAAQTVDAVGDAMTVSQAMDQFGLEADDTIADMLLSEVGGGGGMFEQALDDRVSDVRDELAAEKRIQRGAEADD